MEFTGIIVPISMIPMTSLGRFTASLGACAILTLAARTQAQLFIPGNLVVSEYGSTTATLADGAPTAISLLEYSPLGGPALLTDTLPTTDGVGGSANLGVVGEYGSSSEGNIQLSGNGQYLTIGGYSASQASLGIQASTNTANGTNYPVGTAYSTSTVALAQATDTDLSRVAILIDGNGNVNSSTAFNNLYNTNNPGASTRPMVRRFTSRAKATRTPQTRVSSWPPRG